LPLQFNEPEVALFLMTSLWTN